MKHGTTYGLEGKRYDEGVDRFNVGDHSKHCISNKTSRRRYNPRVIYAETPDVEFLYDFSCISFFVKVQPRYATFQKHAIGGGDKCPNVRGPICMIETTRKRKQTTQ